MKVLMLVYQLDLLVLNWLAEKRGYLSIAFIARCISHTGDGYVQVFVIIWTLLSADPLIRAFGLLLASAFMCERLVYWLAKNSLKRPRPGATLPMGIALIKASDEFSFPSGHTSASVLFASFVFFVKPELGLLAFTWAGLVGISRVVLGVHYPSDIVAGVLLGLGVTFLFI